MSLPATILQPGPPQPERIVAVAATGRALSLDLAPGRLLLDAVRDALAEHGFDGGVVELADVALSPFAYVMPALSSTPEHAAYYSETFRPAGVSRVRAGALTVGQRDGGPFFHGHAIWVEADGRVTGGHILPHETVLAEPATVTAFGLSGATFAAVQDPETNFKLFEPARSAVSEGYRGSSAVALRIRPNLDFCTAIEEACAARGIKHARLRGGVGSTIGARFEDGRVVGNFATEVYVREGLVAPGADGSPQATVDVGLVDYTGAVAEGRLKRGANPVLMTFELVLEAV